MRYKYSVVLISKLVGIFFALIWSAVSGAESAPVHLASLNDDVLSSYISDANQKIGRFLPLLLFGGAGLIVAYAFHKFPKRQEKPARSSKGVRPKRPRSSSSTTVAVTDFIYDTKANNHSSETLESGNDQPNTHLEVEIESDVLTEARVFSTFGHNSQAIWMLLSYLSNKEDRSDEIATELIHLISSEKARLGDGFSEATELREQTVLLFRLVKLHRRNLTNTTKTLFSESFSEYKRVKSENDSVNVKSRLAG